MSENNSDGGTADVLLCGGCSRVSMCRLGLSIEGLDAAGVAHYELACPSSQEGGPGVAHGGWTAAVLDEVLGHVPLLHGQMTVTGTLTVRYLKPVPIELPLVARACVDRVEGVKWFISGELALASSGAILATGTGIWIARDRERHFGAFEDWLAQQDPMSAGRQVRP